jgi:hypothetical protein
MQVICHHGTNCIKYGCSRHHPEGKRLPKDCYHDKKCTKIDCPYYHSLTWFNNGWVLKTMCKIKGYEKFRWSKSWNKDIRLQGYKITIS